jgi:hypothetical protein
MALFRIRYKGLSDVRSISVKDAEKHGVQLSEDMVWDNAGSVVGGEMAGINRPKHSNKARGIVVEGLSDELLKVLRDEGTFTISEIKDDNTEGDPIVTGSALDDTGSVVRDGTTGQETSKGDPDANADPVASAGVGRATGQTGKGRSTKGD